MIFGKKHPSDPPCRPIFDHHRIIVEKNEKTSILSPKELEKAFGIVYLPHLEFPRLTDFFAVSKKIAKFHKKGFLDQKQLWLGAYFQKEIQTPTIPQVRLRWINENMGWGLFAEQEMKPMDYIGEYAGIVRRKKRSDAKNAYCFQYAFINGESTHYTIDAQDHGGIVRFINHSASPNLMTALATFQNLSHIVIFVSRSVKKGEQLCYDYGSDYWRKRTPPQEFTTPLCK